MIPSTLRVTLIIAVLCYFIIILYFLKQRALNLKYTLLWLLAGAVMGVLVVIPELLVRIIHIFGIEDNMNGLFIMCIAFMLMILMALTSIASRQNMKIRTLVQEIGILDKRIRELETSIEEQQDKSKTPLQATGYQTCSAAEQRGI